MEGRLTFVKLSTIALLAMAVLASAALLVKSLFAAPAAEIVVATVNGDDITAEELAYFAGLHRASVIETFLAEEVVVMDKRFWQRDIRGVSPIEKLRELALEDAVAMKAELQLAHELGLTSDVSYASLLEAMEKENARRAKAVANGEPIYGPAKFEERTFIDFYRGKLATLSKESLAESEFAPMDERELVSFYERISTMLSPMANSLTYDKIAITYRYDGKDGDKRTEEAFRMATVIRERLLTGEAATEAVLAEAAFPAGMAAAYEEKLELNESNASRMFKSNNSLYTALQEASEGQPVTSVIDDPIAGQYVIARVTDWQAAEVPKFEEVRDVVRKLYVEERYSAYMQSRVEAAAVLLLPAYYESKLGVE
ncbi:hypothetical protein B1748_35295 [Paenibacillus sp. MY03]|uniref:hypothetical protein n=1 Tax=Paenibacillus sp. MY03 TaxID=302980 RepID=UPI000B3C03EE|nr:hypothetical protein [Paenibacillus sp. MY03]OUS67905.1 hypothetical protein B1748_35295 [Paenibacillus sp. MY03]